MSTAPAFASIPTVGAAIASGTADTSLTAPTNVATLVFAPVVGASGAKIEEIRFEATATTVAGTVNLFLYDGTTYHVIDQIAVSLITLSTVVPSWSTVRQYRNLWIPQSTWSLRFGVSIAGLQSIIKVVAFGANL